MEYSIRKLESKDINAYHDLCSDAAANNPESYPYSFKETTNYDGQRWEEHFNELISNNNSQIIVVEDNDKLVGMIGIDFKTNPKYKHVAKFHSFYVRKENRKSGLGSSIIDYAKAHITEHRKEIIKLRLTVKASQEDAIHLYQKKGFRINGILTKANFEDGVYKDLYLMEQFLDEDTPVVKDLQQCPVCKRYNNRGASVDAVIMRNNKILLIKRKNEPQKGMWALPGGYIEWNENAEQALRHEILEETGLTLKKSHFINYYTDPGRSPKQVINFGFYAVTEGEPKAGDDAEELAFFDLAELPKLAFDHNKIVQDYISKFLNDYSC